MAERSVAYVLKGYPRMSELFIASEIWRLEQLGMGLRLFVLKPADEDQRHAVVDRVAAVPSYLPPTTSLSGQRVLSWLRVNGGQYVPALVSVARRHPLPLLRAAAAAAAQAVRARRGWRRIRTIYLKEFLLAVEVADRVERSGDVVHLHGHFAHGATTVTWLASMITGLPFSFTGHAKDIYRLSLNPVGLLARKLHAAAFVVTCTGANRDHLLQIAPGSRVHTVYHGLNADFAQLLEDHPEPAKIIDTDVEPEGRLRVVSVGRLVPKKGFDVLLDAVAALRHRGVDVELVIAGEDGEAGPALRQRVADQGLADAVTIMGPLSQRELLGLYRSATVFALACRIIDNGDRDGIPNVLVEAMAAGLPVVSTAVSGIPELVVDGRNGLLVPPEDPAVLADALHLVHKDPVLRAQLAAAGQVTVNEHFDGERLARRLATLFPGACR